MEIKETIRSQKVGQPIWLLSMMQFQLSLEILDNITHGLFSKGNDLVGETRQFTKQ